MALKVAGRKWLTRIFPTHSLFASKYFDSNQPHLRLPEQMKQNIFFCVNPVNAERKSEMRKRVVILAAQAQ